MRDLLEELGRTIKSIFEDDRPSWDPDMQDAWKELNSFLDDEAGFEEVSPDGSQSRRNRHADAHGGRTRSYGDRTAENLTKDYRNLELEPGADIEEVRKAYKRLLALYHPDRHATDPEKQRLATEITSRLNESYTRITQSMR